jgi:hypothetical protein
MKRFLSSAFSFSSFKQKPTETMPGVTSSGNGSGLKQLEEGVGDYVYAAATRDYGIGVWADALDAGQENQPMKSREAGDPRKSPALSQLVSLFRKGGK